MSRKPGSNKYKYYLQVARAGVLWERCYSREQIAKMLGVTVRMVDYYVAKWRVGSDEVLTFIEIRKEQAGRAEQAVE